MTTEKDPRGILLKEFLDEYIRDHTSSDYDVMERAQAFFEKSAKQEQGRNADFSEWIEKITAQPHTESPAFEEETIEASTEPAEHKSQQGIGNTQPEVYYEGELIEPVAGTEAHPRIDLAELTEDKISEPIIDSENDELPLTDAEFLLAELETSDEAAVIQKEKVENAERSL